MTNIPDHIKKCLNHEFSCLISNDRVESNIYHSAPFKLEIYHEVLFWFRMCPIINLKQFKGITIFYYGIDFKNKNIGYIQFHIEKLNRNWTSWFIND